ncbi:hypothetical protein CMO93_03285 [Candidatus Woesearchaeota archaeon]|nr:hypothetical protein [Candidatus Woesearchaeota archaeon]|tara:strand:- start:147 stop:788 length:642 start_codon:yes stop_codon:yes gene_type:complete
MKLPPKLSPNKKAAERNILNALLGSVLSVLAIFFLLYVGNLLLGLFTSNQAEASTLNNLKELSFTVEKVLKEGEKEKAFYYIDSDFTLIGFDHSASRAITSCDEEKEIVKPEKCKQNSCLCIFEEEIFVDCHPFSEKINFLALDKADLFQGIKKTGTDYESLVIDGDNCDKVYTFKDDWVIKDLLIEKKQDNIIFSIVGPDEIEKPGEVKKSS